MQPISTDGVAWSLCVSMCLSVGHVHEPYKNGWTDRDAVSVDDSGGHKEPCSRWGPDLQWEGQFLEVVRPIKSIARHCCGVCSKKSIKESVRLVQLMSLGKTVWPLV